VDTKKSKVAPKAADGEPVEAMASDELVHAVAEVN
jgi:hypothetical protein